MTRPASLIPELEEVVQHGSAAKRAAMLRQITDLFIDQAGHFSEEHVRLFDDVFCRLVVEIESKALAELSRRLAPIDNAPAEVVRRLAHYDDIAIAGPLLARSLRLRDPDLVDIAETKGQDHLLAISGRAAISEAVTDVLVRRGERQVVHNVAANQRARLSEESFRSLIDRAGRDGPLAEKIGLRQDIPPHLFRELVMKAGELVQKRLLASARPDTQAEIRRVITEISEEIGAKAKARDYREAQRTVVALYKAGKLSETDLVGFAKDNRFEETVAALSAICAVPIEVVDRLMSGERSDPVLILCKAAGFGWGTVRAIIGVHPAGQRMAGHGLDETAVNFERLSPSTAQRVVRFWQARPGDEFDLN
ncbi:MAG TPA: DUF2336 domain-containing protein [Xanthobacteraceae bacterium]|jgi:uncharacterized protein (DUF2336 family)|nr:DUF2336 domain-containing protein [Xanthobacteraceae bacterium]